MTSPGKNSEEYLERVKRRSERDKQRRGAAAAAHVFWERLVNKVGEPEAKGIMRHEMGDKKSGPPLADEDIALRLFIYGYLLHWGADQTDAKIAKRIFESEPQYLELKSGAVIVANTYNEFNETYMSDPDDPVVGRRPIDMDFSALKKRIERHRRWAIKEEFLPKECAPRNYCRD